MSHPWITEDVFIAGMYRIAWEHKGGFLPEPATALDFFEVARVKVEREAAARLNERHLAALPAPESEHALTDREVADVVWIRNWYARTMSARQDAAYLDERMDPADLAFQRDCERFEDVVGHIPDLPPEQLKAALRKYAGRWDKSAVAVQPAVEKAAENIGAWPR